ncbi:S66 peptidase family protein [uncultured Agrococcus sp.]|uniref:S66 family peptidase n=1 Tax=uncultured Agrococcus sp. TaxID=382258 RepID=UPI0025D2D451|nr:S66 peptidase family protein [uncultured Agrococcus sp.]
MHALLQPAKLRGGDRVAILSPSFAAPAAAPAIHEQAMTRFAETTGLVPVEFPTTRQLGATPEERAADFNRALADRSIRAIVSTLGGDDQIRLIRHLDARLLRSDPKPFLGYSDNTNILNWMWTHGVAGFYGGSTQVHFGPGPGTDDAHIRTLMAALRDGGELELVDPGESEDHGIDWQDSRALTEFGHREPTEPWRWFGPQRSVTGTTWGGCLEIIDWLGLADRIPNNEDLRGAILLLETSEELPSTETVRRWVRALGERGLLEVIAGAVIARPPVTEMGGELEPVDERRALRTEQYEAIFSELSAYNSEAVMCAGPPFGHTRPQLIVPFGGKVTIDGLHRRIFASYA